MSGGSPDRSRLAHYSLWAAQLLLSGLAVYLAMIVAETALFQQLSWVVSDHISRGLGQPEASHVTLLRVPSSLSESDLAKVLLNGLPTLISDYQPAGIGVDIDFSKGGSPELAKMFSDSGGNPALARKVVWAARPKSEEAPDAALRPVANEHEQGLCEDCSGSSCLVRFDWDPVFGKDGTVENFGLPLVFPNPADPYDVNRWSARYFCVQGVQARVKSFHFRLVELYCEKSSLATCTHLEPNAQAAVNIRSWYQAQPLDLCQFVNCGTAASKAGSNDDRKLLRGKILLLYRDIPGNDEHLTFVGMQKGGAIVASLIENELNYGVSPYWRAPLLKWTIEIVLAVLLLALFHWRLAHYLAIPGAAAVFWVYLLLVPKLATLVPDFRDYVLAIIVTFWFEMYLKLVWISYRAKE